MSTDSVPYLDPHWCRVISSVGRGGFAQVYAVAIYNARGEERKAALKVLKPVHQASAPSLKFAERLFLSEAKTSATLVHRNLVRCYGLFRLSADFPGVGPLSGPTWGILLEYCEAGNLREHILDSAMQCRCTYTGLEALQWLADLAAGLHHLHSCHPTIVHRDVKPENVLLRYDHTQSRTVAKLADLGLHVPISEARSVMLRRRLLDRPSSATFIAITSELAEAEQLTTAQVGGGGAAAAGACRDGSGKLYAACVGRGPVPNRGELGGEDGTGGGSAGQSSRELCPQARVTSETQLCTATQSPLPARPGMAGIAAPPFSEDLDLEVEAEADVGAADPRAYVDSSYCRSGTTGLLAADSPRAPWPGPQSGAACVACSARHIHNSQRNLDIQQHIQEQQRQQAQEQQRQQAQDAPRVGPGPTRGAEAPGGCAAATAAIPWAAQPPLTWSFTQGPAGIGSVVPANAPAVICSYGEVPENNADEPAAAAVAGHHPVGCSNRSTQRVSHGSAASACGGSPAAAQWNSGHFDSESRVGFGFGTGSCLGGDAFASTTPELTLIRTAAEAIDSAPTQAAPCEGGCPIPAAPTRELMLEGPESPSRVVPGASSGPGDLADGAGGDGVPLICRLSRTAPFLVSAGQEESARAAAGGASVPVTCRAEPCAAGGDPRVVQPGPCLGVSSEGPQLLEGAAAAEALAGGAPEPDLPQQHQGVSPPLPGYTAPLDVPTFFLSCGGLTPMRETDSTAHLSGSNVLRTGGAAINIITVEAVVAAGHGGAACSLLSNNPCGAVDLSAALATVNVRHIDATQSVPLPVLHTGGGGGGDGGTADELATAAFTGGAGGSRLWAVGGGGGGGDGGHLLQLGRISTAAATIHNANACEVRGCCCRYCREGLTAAGGPHPVLGLDVDLGLGLGLEQIGGSGQPYENAAVPLWGNVTTTPASEASQRSSPPPPVQQGPPGDSRRAGGAGGRDGDDDGEAHQVQPPPSVAPGGSVADVVQRRVSPRVVWPFGATAPSAQQQQQQQQQPPPQQPNYQKQQPQPPPPQQLSPRGSSASTSCQDSRTALNGVTRSHDPQPQPVDSGECVGIPVPTATRHAAPPPPSRMRSSTLLQGAAGFQRASTASLGSPRISDAPRRAPSTLAAAAAAAATTAAAAVQPPLRRVKRASTGLQCTHSRATSSASIHIGVMREDSVVSLFSRGSAAGPGGCVSRRHSGLRRNNSSGPGTNCVKCGLEVQQEPGTVSWLAASLPVRPAVTTGGGVAAGSVGGLASSPPQLLPSQLQRQESREPAALQRGRGGMDDGDGGHYLRRRTYCRSCSNVAAATAGASAEAVVLHQVATTERDVVVVEEEEEAVSVGSLDTRMRRMSSMRALLRTPAEGKLPEHSALHWVYGLTGQAGSCMSMAPEVYLHQPYNEKCDVFGFGVLMYELLSYELLLHSYINTVRAERLGVHSPSDYAAKVSQGFRPPRPRRLSDSQWALVCRCWHQDPCERPSMGEVLQQLTEMIAARQAQQRRRSAAGHPEVSSSCSNPPGSKSGTASVTTSARVMGLDAGSRPPRPSALRVAKPPGGGTGYGSRNGSADGSGSKVAACACGCIVS